MFACHFCDSKEERDIIGDLNVFSKNVVDQMDLRDTRLGIAECVPQGRCTMCEWVISQERSQLAWSQIA